eukprot:3724613-Lingulodinium_polyedra.AAC.1
MRWSAGSPAPSFGHRTFCSPRRCRRSPWRRAATPASLPHACAAARRRSAQDGAAAPGHGRRAGPRSAAWPRLPSLAT